MLKKLLQSRIHTPSDTPVLPATQEGVASASSSRSPSAFSKRPPKPVPQGQVRPKSRSMRDSDIKDEHGRSAEEIAAEAAREFDIASVVAKAASMPDAPDRPVRPKTSLVSPLNYPKHKADNSRIHVADAAPEQAPADLPHVAQADPQHAPNSHLVPPAARPVTQVFQAADPGLSAPPRPATQVFQAPEHAIPARPATQVFQAPAEMQPAVADARPMTSIIPAPAPDAAPQQRPVSQILQTPEALLSAGSRPISQILEVPAEKSTSARPISRIVPSIQEEPERSAARSKPLELGKTSRIHTAGEKVNVIDGHIAALGPSQETIYATEDAREYYWEAIGESDEELLSYPVTPELRGMPAWPTQMQAFRIVRTANSVIIASEGLSDAFGPYDTRSGKNGFGLEVYIEIVGWQSMIATNIHKNWAFNAVEHVARIAAHAQNFSELLRGGDVLSMDLPQSCVPKPWVVPGVAEPAGALLGVPQPPGRSKIKNMPLSDVMVVPITPIFPEELESCVVEGPKERQALAHDLLTTGAGHRADMERTSLR